MSTTFINPYVFGGDPYFSSVTLLCHFDGTNGSTTIADSSQSAQTLTASGSAALTTTSPKFGTACLDLPNVANTYARATANAGFGMGSGDFTIEGWFKTTNSFADGSDHIMASNYNFTANARSWALGSNNGAGKIRFSWSTDGTAASSIDANANGQNDGNWHHIAVVRSGTSIFMFIDGTKQTATGSVSGSLFSSTNFSFGEYSQENSGRFIGQLDDWRITKGVARYTADFTAPSSPFSDS